ncbi:MAG: ComEC family competence protein, partial [Candidatus Kaiserbacteria bacterium]|nr:ComEC family competence protein [Candidatus Kaiserbacteria bacterium]
MKEYLLLAIILGFLAGVFARSFFSFGLAVAGFMALLAIASLLLAYADRTKREPLIVIAIALVAFGAGIWRMNSAVLVGEPELTSRIENEITVEGFVEAEPDVRENSMRISVHADTLIIATRSIAIRAGILAVVPSNTLVNYGDRVKTTGTLRIPQPFDTGNDRQFHYPEYLAKDGIGYQLAFAELERVEGESSANIFKKGAIWVKQKFVKGLETSLAEPAAGLAKGITVGEKRGLGDELNGIFITVGLIHILVLSGYNITLVINSAGKALARFPRSVYFSGAVIIAIFFALMTGGAPSSVRAALMAVIAALGRVTGRLYFASRALAVVAFGMVLWNPFVLAFDVGFQLSVLATFGLIWFTPVFAGHLRWITKKFQLQEIAASTLGTQLAVLPLLLYQNGLLPIFSLPANLLALVAVPPAMAATAIASVGGLFAEPISAIIAFPAYILLTYIIEVAKFFASLPFASVAISAFSAWWMFGAYA